MPADIFVRTATLADDALVSELLKASYPVLMRESYAPDSLAAALPALTKANPAWLHSGTYYVAETESPRVVGCGGWTREPPGCGDVEDGLGHIRRFATHPDWIGRSVGRSIYDICERQARSSGVTRFECQSSLNAEGFYATLGFESIRRIDLRLNPHQTIPSVLMRRFI